MFKCSHVSSCTQRLHALGPGMPACMCTHEHSPGKTLSRATPLAARASSSRSPKPGNRVSRKGIPTFTGSDFSQARRRAHVVFNRLLIDHSLNREKQRVGKSPSKVAVCLCHQDYGRFPQPQSFIPVSLAHSKLNL